MYTSATSVKRDIHDCEVCSKPFSITNAETDFLSDAEATSSVIKSLVPNFDIGSISSNLILGYVGATNCDL